MTDNMFSASDFEKMGLEKCQSSAADGFLDTINGETLGKKVMTAIGLKKQGHFNRAMLHITEANRDHVIAIRKIQGILDRWANRNKTEIGFKNFRQTLPLQIGLSNGKDVLELLDKVRFCFDRPLSERTDALHRAEKDLEKVHAEFLFFQKRMKGRISSDERDDLQGKVIQCMRKVHRAKKEIADALIEFVNEKYESLVAEDRVSLIGHLYKIITSSIETKDFKLVNV